MQLQVKMDTILITTNIIMNNIYLESLCYLCLFRTVQKSNDIMEIRAVIH